MKNKNNTDSYLKISLVSLLASVLAACGGVGSDELVVNDIDSLPDEVVASRVLFDPGAGVLPLPSDLLFSGTLDGTIEAPDEVAGRDDGNVDLGNPAVALGGVDGWSTQMPMQISLDLPEGVTLDASSIGPTNVYMVRTNCGLGLTGCTPPFTALTFGVDFVAIGDPAGTITIVPITPLAASTNHLVALTNGILDSSGEAIRGSALYEQVTRDDIDIDFAGLDSLQDAINGYEALITAGTGVAASDMVFTASWTTASSGDAILATAQAVTPAFMPAVTNIAPHSDFTTTADFNASLPGIADVYEGTLTLPYFLAESTAQAPTAALTERFNALCDNGVLLSQADPAVLGAAAPGANDATCMQLGLRDLGLDAERYVTRFNPVPETRSIQPLEVIITVPNALSGNLGPFPIVMYQHGITANKESLLAFADALASQGYAAVAIDLPLHGSRGFDVDGDGTDEINASTVDVQHYMNLGFLLTGRDNLRQSVLDMIGLRKAVANGFTFAPASTISDADFDRSGLDFVGMSLGGITGTVFTATTALIGEPVDSSALVVPGGGIVPLLLSSESFGPLVQGTVLEAAGVDPAADPAVAAATLGSFAFAAQTIIEAADPNNFAATAAASTPIYMAQVRGDMVIPNRSSFGGLPFGGTEPLAALMGLDRVSFGDAPVANGHVIFSEGGHGSFLDPTDSATATLEMQTQVVTFVAGGVVAVTDAGVVEPGADD